MSYSFGGELEVTDKITLELTLDELKLIDKYVELNDETKSVFDKIKVAYPISPVEEAFKDWWGQYPETGFWDGFDEKRWQGFQAGYEFAYQEKVSETAQERGERLHKDVERVVKESVKWCEDHPDWDLFDYLKPPTPEQKFKEIPELLDQLDALSEFYPLPTAVWRDIRKLMFLSYDKGYSKGGYDTHMKYTGTD